MTWWKSTIKGNENKPMESTSISNSTNDEGESKELNVTPQKKTTWLQNVVA